MTTPPRFVLLGLLIAAGTCGQAPAADLPSTVMGSDGAEMVLVPAGPFLMGSTDGEPDERPVHTVSVAAFYIDRYEVTHAQYAMFLQAKGHKPPIDWSGGKMPSGREKYPVVNVTWADADAYARWAGKRLPTEAEWEKAARGTDGRIYPWGNDASKKSAAGKDAQDPRRREGRTFAVGSFPDDVSPSGAMDMAGNVWEWTADWYNAYPGNLNLELEYGHKYRVIRGGAAIDYYGKPSTRRCATRARSVPYGTFDALGFRCVKEAK
jgi:formylglycine-generating enzyme required for sulfatase activity